MTAPIELVPRPLAIAVVAGRDDKCNLADIHTDHAKSFFCMCVQSLPAAIDIDCYNIGTAMARQQVRALQHGFHHYSSSSARRSHAYPVAPASVTALLPTKQGLSRHFDWRYARLTEIQYRVGYFDLSVFIERRGKQALTDTEGGSTRIWMSERDDWQSSRDRQWLSILNQQLAQVFALTQPPAVIGAVLQQSLVVVDQLLKTDAVDMISSDRKIKRLFFAP